ncbi:MAG: hypothetical protein EGR16_10555 [Clostridiales bacterium]|nr:hypothetical protein [Clostridiales bacterium]MBD9010756.1 hypothetical protein [Clostridiales bacterium]
MPREKPYYRDVLADLSERFDNKMQVRIGEVCEIMKISPYSARNRYSFDKGGWISLYTLARDICKDF